MAPLIRSCRAGELQAPVGIMTFKGILNHIDDIKALATDFPDTKIIMDHFGFCKASDPASEEWKALMSLAEFPQVYVKVSRSLAS
jgi:predicted TIM-barrel fold metal-dependent hydrolase